MNEALRDFMIWIGVGDTYPWGNGDYIAAWFVAIIMVAVSLSLLLVILYSINCSLGNRWEECSGKVIDKLYTSEGYLTTQRFVIVVRLGEVVQQFTVDAQKYYDIVPGAIFVFYKKYTRFGHRWCTTSFEKPKGFQDWGDEYGVQAIYKNKKGI